MKTTIKKELRSVAYIMFAILAAAILALSLGACVKPAKVATETIYVHDTTYVPTSGLPIENVMLIYTRGYLTGSLRMAQNGYYNEPKFKADSTELREQLIKDVYLKLKP